MPVPMLTEPMPTPVFMEFMEPTAHHASSIEGWHRAERKREGTTLLVAACESKRPRTSCLRYMLLFL